MARKRERENKRRTEEIGEDKPAARPEYDFDPEMSLDLETSFSLESILAEYGEKSRKESGVPVQDYIDRTNRIIRDTAGKSPVFTPVSFDAFHEKEKKEAPASARNGVTAEKDAGERTPEKEKQEKPAAAEKAPERIRQPEPEKKAPVWQEEDADPLRELRVDPATQITDENAGTYLDELLKKSSAGVEEKKDEDFFRSKTRYAEKQDNVVVVDFGAAAEEDGEEEEEQPRPPKKSALRRLFHAPDLEEEEEEDEWDEEEDADDGEEPDEEPEEEPDYVAQAAVCGKGINGLSMRSTLAFLLCVLMGVLTFLYETGRSIPLGISGFAMTAGILGLMNISVTALAIECFSDGLSDFVRAQPGMETLAAFSSLACTADVIFCLAEGADGRGLPLCLVSSFAMFLSMKARLQYRSSLRDALRMPAAVAAPSSVIPVDLLGDDRMVLRKAPERLNGFYRKLTGADLTEQVYALAAPVLILVSLTLAAVTTLGKGSGQHFLFVLSAFLAVSTSFAGIIAYTKPFFSVTKMLRRVGIAIAGWCGAEVIDESDGALVTDADVFPAGTSSVSGIKLFEGVPLSKAVVYTSSLVLASGSSLTRAFSDLLATQALHAENVEDFACYDGGGLSALVRGERVYVGSAGFINLMGIRVPENVSVNNGVYTAINDELASVISISYMPANSVQAALVSLMRAGVNMLFAMRDFNVTPLMLQQKFKVSLDEIEYVPVDVCYNATETELPPGTDAVAVLCREGLGQMADAITRSRRLVTVCRLNTILAVLSSVIGVLFMLVICGRLAFAAISCMRLFFFQFAVLLITLFISSIVKWKK